MLIEAAPDIYFDDDYYRRYDVVLVRLANIDEGRARRDAGACSRDIQAPKARKL